MSSHLASLQELTAQLAELGKDNGASADAPATDEDRVAFDREFADLLPQVPEVEAPVALIPEPAPVPAAITQPDANGEFASPLDGALWMAITWGIPQTPLRGKAPFLKEWQKRASTDPEQIQAWYRELNCNFGSVALPDGIFIFEVDSPDVKTRFGKDFTSQLIIESRPGRGHRYYKHVAGVENISQDNLHGDFSLRADGEQCVSPGSVNPESGQQYRVKVSNALVAPSLEEITFWNSEKKVEKKKVATVTDEEAPIPQGRRNATLASIAGALRAKGLVADEIETVLLRHNRERCQPSLPDSEVHTIAHSIGSK